MNTQNLFDAYTKLCSMQRSNGVAIHMHRSGGATVAVTCGPTVERDDLLTAICDAYDQLVPPTVRTCGGTEDVEAHR